MVSSSITTPKRFLIGSPLWLCCLASSLKECNGAISTSQIIVGSIYTVDPNNPWADAIAIDEDGVIQAVGTEEDAMSAFDENGNVTITILGDNQLLLPGFHDVHLHAVEAGINEDQSICYIDPNTYPEDLPYELEGGFGFDCKVGGGGENEDQQEWIFATGVSVAFLLKAIENELSEYPINVLDEWFPDTPVLILDSLGHGKYTGTHVQNSLG